MKVLLVDDDLNLLKDLQRRLHGKIEADTAHDGNEALAKVAAHGPYAVVVSDYRMPGMDGVQLLTKVRKMAPDTVRVLLTGHADLEIAIRAVNQGGIFRLLTKPSPPGEFEAVLEDGIEQHRLLQSRGELAVLKRLQEGMEGIIAGFSALVEARDPYTAGHQRRVTRLTTAIAAGMGLGPEFTLGLKLASLVHDIGKVYVPAGFLNRPGRLSFEEFAIIKLHPQVGSDILAPVDFSWPISKIVLQHHERLDGSGYPGGIKGGKILLEARILAVADVVDAMNSHRPYRPGLGVEMALKEIEAGRGVVFDADVVDACLTLFREQGFVLDGK